MNKDSISKLEAIIEEMKTVESYFLNSGNEPLENIGRLVGEWYTSLESIIDEEAEEGDKISIAIENALRDIQEQRVRLTQGDKRKNGVS